MRKRILCFLMTLVMTVMLVPENISAQQSSPVVLTDDIVTYDTSGDSVSTITPVKPEGSGTIDSPYQIANAANLYWFADNYNIYHKRCHAILTKDIVVNQNVLKADGSVAENADDFVSWTPIGQEGDYRFHGTFDGAGHSISGLYFKNEESQYVGLFGGVYTNNGYGENVVKNLLIKDSFFHGKSRVGAICGESDGTVRNCASEATVEGANSVGGICGTNDGNMESCYNVGRVSGTSDIGGIVGTIAGDASNYTKNCYSLSGTNMASRAYGYHSTFQNSTRDKVELKDDMAFSNGEVCYLLNHSRSVGTTEDPILWFQKLSEFGGDKYPVLYSTGTNTVYELEDGGYANSYRGNVIRILTQPEDIAVGVNEITDSHKLTISVDRVVDDAGTIQYQWYKNSVSDANKIIGATSSEMTIDKNLSIGTYTYVCQVTCDETILTSSNAVVTVTKWDEPSKIDDIYQIKSASQLAWFANEVNENGQVNIKGKLLNNIDLSNICNATIGNWVPIGTNTASVGSTCQGNTFQGTFDGGSHTIGGLYMKNPGNYSGLFGAIEGGTVENLNVTGEIILTTNTNDCIGGVAGSAYGTSTFSQNCSNVVISGTGVARYVGGIVGEFNKHNSETTTNITRCMNKGEISLSNSCCYVGGIVGYASRTKILNSGNYGNVTASKDATDDLFGVGGIVGSIVGTPSTISSCLNTGTIYGGSGYTGGIAGMVSSETTYQNNYFLNTVSNGSGTNNTVDSAATVSKSVDELGSGEVGFLLNNPQNAGNIYWTQKLGKNGDPAPTCISGGNGTGIYQHEVKNCAGKTKVPTAYVYTNEYTEPLKEDHVYDQYDNCINCGFQKPSLNENDSTSDKDDYYEIKDASQLYWFAEQVNDYGKTSINVKLMNDITVNDSVLNTDGSLAEGSEDFEFWTPLGYSYQGTFDGSGHSIRGLYATGDLYVGFISRLGEGGNVRNLTIADSYIKGDRYVGSICGENSFGTVENCANVSTVDGSHTVGGICGMESHASIKNCINIGDIKGESNVGTICGYGQSGQIATCYFLPDNDSLLVLGENLYVTVLDSEEKTKDEFTTGEVCYLLTKDSQPIHWYQNLTSQRGTVDKFPVQDASHAIVHKKGDSYYNKVANEIAFISSHNTFTYDGQPISFSDYKGVDFTWLGDSTISINYFVKAESGQYIKTTLENSGAALEGGAPVKAGTYYAQVTTSEDLDYVETSSDYFNFVINKASIPSKSPATTMTPLNSVKSVGSIVLPEGWQWEEEDSIKQMLVGKPITATAVYLGQDADNFVQTTVLVTITRQSCEHVWSDWSVVKEPTYDLEGEEKRTCSVCNEVQVRVIPKLIKPTPVPTPTTSSQPTLTPAPTATNQPTLAPTPTTSSQPTLAPTPTTPSQPTLAPTPTTPSQPTLSPTPMASIQPTLSPEPTATNQPTPAPTPMPAPGPTATNQPTLAPTPAMPSQNLNDVKKIRVGKVKIKKLKNKRRKKLIIKYKKVAGANGYVISYSTNSKFTKKKKKITTKKTQVTIKKLKKKTYYVKVRAYKFNSSKKKVYGKYSIVKKIKIKR